MIRLFHKAGHSAAGVSMILVVSMAASALSVAPSSAAAGPLPSGAGCEILSKLREANRETNSAIASGKAQKVVENLPDFDAEEAGCISDYGANLGFGAVTALAKGLLSSLEKAACQAVDNYINDSISKIGVSISAPMDLGELSVSLGRSNSLITVDDSGRELGINFDKVMGDLTENLPTYSGDKIQVDGDMYVDRLPGSQYTTQSRGQSIPTPNYNPGLRR
ncbi:hypothetical protein BTO32_14830 [Marinobacter lutaoensis]|uniref:Uncharacterized protein n=1 Tax=Marinobacter lutaoensis TaxID=135739 RepID=A0A1V2DQ02_9GAMM|nr:hypothetical protein [Marinobacter lutaoensis]ONF42486.1 hypothetical protein BTO32_14830 [Marinobacter lutaoensis]